jgi:hypothetical protein
MKARDKAKKAWPYDPENRLFASALEAVGAMETMKQTLVDYLVKGAPPCEGKPCHCGCAPCLEREGLIMCRSCVARSRIQDLVEEFTDLALAPSPRRRRGKHQQQAGPCTGAGSAPEPKLDPVPPRASQRGAFSPDQAPAE